jgi:vesicle-associated membrane protein 7
LYAVFARQDIKLCEYKKQGVDFMFQITQITQQILTRIDHTATARRSFKTSSQPELHFHVQVLNGLTVLCVSDPEFTKKCAHFFLNEAMQAFLATTKDWTTAPALHYQNVFARQLEQIAEKNSNPMNDKASYVRSQMKEAKEMYMEQINLLIERGEHIDILEDKTKTLANESIIFREKAKAMKMRFFLKNIKLIIVIVIIALLALFMLVWFGCGVPDFATCADMIKKLKGDKPATLQGADVPAELNGTLDPNNPVQPPPENPPPPEELVEPQPSPLVEPQPSPEESPTVQSVAV